ncbi:MAG: TRAP transporter TatT component family protein, partial [Pyrinomonadaceae bacterium]
QAQVEGPLSGLSLAKELRQRMETVLKLDEGYQGGSAFMVLGRLDVELPKMLGGDPERAVKTLERGLRYGENNSLLRLRLAEAYLKVKRPEDARREVKYILDMKPHPDFLPEYKESAEGAKQLLERRL